MKYLLGIDIGTYSSKGVLVTEAGDIVGSTSVQHTLDSPRPGWAEHDAEVVWWDGFVRLTRNLLLFSGLLPSQIAAIGISAISPAILPIDEHGRPLCQAILYGIDTRAVREVQDLQKVIDQDLSMSRLGIQLSSQSAAPKVEWIRRYAPEVWARTRQIVNGSGFILNRLTGENTIDVYSASAYSPFLDLERGEWNQNSFNYIAPREYLPLITWPYRIAGRVTHQGARLSALAEGTIVITGTADAAAEAISAGVSTPGDLMVMYGSSVFFILRTQQMLRTPHFWSAPFLEPNTYVLAGGMSTGGSLTRWFRDRFAPLELQVEEQGGASAYSALEKIAASSPPGANGLVMLPYFSGERTPILDPDAKGVIFGLGLHHTRADIYRALLESIGYGILHNIEFLKLKGETPRRIFAIGGGTLNSLLVQIVSDIANVEQYIPQQQVGASYGDAFLAGIGCGLLSSPSQASEWFKSKHSVKPDPETQKRYSGYYKIYRELYTRNSSLMKQLTLNLQEN